MIILEKERSHILYLLVSSSYILLLFYIFIKTKIISMGHSFLLRCFLWLWCFLRDFSDLASSSFYSSSYTGSGSGSSTFYSSYFGSSSGTSSSSSTISIISSISSSSFYSSNSDSDGYVLLLKNSTILRKLA